MFYRCHGLNIDQAELFVLPPDLLPLPSPRHQTVVNVSSLSSPLGAVSQHSLSSPLGAVSQHSLSSPLGAVSQHSSPHPWEQSPSIHLLTPGSSLPAFPLLTPRSSLPAFPLLTPRHSLPAFISSPLGTVSQHSSPHPWEQSPSKACWLSLLCLCCSHCSLLHPGHSHLPSEQLSLK